ncbi:hypothetical protein [Ancylobacter amanitiformis]|uniref:Uncharacterized protein n=1 Tax=Ancylobacter amanitiformis TaxID=217069 RepID=A0ABU0LQC6_9HYPH|nr:hypothetical protein [Ancylobacter amanitiformis]MDQ0510902.1 hypothetical protein [Ancylobacter amanitiformis]
MTTEAHPVHEVARFHDDALSVSAGGFSLDLTVKQIEGTWDALSHFPDRRARMELGALAERLNAFAAHVVATIERGGNLDASAEVERFAVRHVSMTRRAWAMDSRCMSWFVVGPARFPVDRNRKRMDWAENAFRALGEHVKAARASVERTAFPHGAPGEPIRASNPDAPALIRAEIEKHRASHALMKAANAAIRSARGKDVDTKVQAVVDATGWREATARRCVVPPQKWMGAGFAAYQLSGELAEIKRLEDRLATIERNRERGTVEREHNTAAGRLRVVENGEAARIQLFFDGKPAAEVRDTLKREGFRWAPSEGAWQRHLNNGGRYAVSRVVSALQPAGA